MKSNLVILLLACTLLATGEDAPVFKDLFNGRDLTGWVDVNTSPATWSVKDGLLVCTGLPIGVMRSEKQYENFILHLEWRHMQAGGNSGVFVWSEGTPAPGGSLPKGMEVQMLELEWPNLNRQPDGSPNHPGYVSGELFGANGLTATPDNPRGERSMSKEPRCKGKGEWNTYDVVCVDGTIKLSINGKFVNGMSQSSVRKGYLCLESEGSEIHFRNIRLLELPATAQVSQAAKAPLTEAAKITFRSGSNTMLANGKPIFPVGFYDVAWKYNTEEMITAIDAMADAGFNLIHTSRHDEVDYNRVLDRAAQRGVYVITEGHGFDADYLSSKQSHPAVLGWNLGDDVHTNISPDQLAEKDEVVKSADPHHLRYFADFYSDRLETYLKAGQVAGPYDYPIDNSSDASLGDVEKIMDRARKAGRPMLGVPQSFRWPGNDGENRPKRLPSGKEGRNMTYINIANGVEGILYYCWREYGTALPQEAPELWEELKRTRQELRVLEPALNEGQFTKNPTENDIVSSHWRHEGKLYVIAINLSNEGRNVSVILPENFTGSPRSLFSGRPATLQVADGRLTGGMGGQEVQVYVF